MASADDPAGSEQQQLSSEDYTVGWICALATEYVAAQAFLDQVHGTPAYISIHDSNDYTLGRIGKHNVAIAVLPFGAYSTSSGAAVARDMLHTFPNIRIGLMVGIGGGAPSLKHDIRLGDVIVGEPQNGLGGVVQCDFAKNTHDQPFRSAGFLASPPPVLLTAISGLQAKYQREGHNIRESIETSLAAKERLREKFGRPDATTDRLYKSHVVHLKSDIPCVESCGVDEASIILRAIRDDDDDDDPTIHYGLIASANHLMKDAKLRDQLANESGILCFEMEAAGLMNQFPCLVIRGICDYSDTHKNKEWQGYAAMTAAAYAKDLLNMITPSDVEAETKIGELFVNHFLEVVQWLSPPDPSINQKNARAQHQPGTIRWFLDSDKYLSWKTGRPSFLCVYGMPGCGKTILSSAVIADLEENTTSQEILYFYFDFADIAKKSTENAVRSLIHQLYCKRAGARRVVDSLYASYHESGQQPTYVVLRTVLNTIIQECGETWIILDGLDECETHSQHAVDGVIPWIKNLRNLLSDVHLLVTSRPERDIKSSIEIWASFGQVFPIQSDLVADDIEVYIHTKLEQMIRWQGQPDIQKLIATTLNGRANGMFQWVAYQFDILEHCFSRADVSRVLTESPRALDETYARILYRLPHEYKARGIKLLQILVCSKRPLLIEEALNTIGSKPRFDAASRRFIEEELARLCSNLVCFTLKYHDKTSAYVTEIRLLHFSVQEYLQSNRLAPTIASYFDEERLARDFPDQLAPERALANLIVEIYSEISTANVDIQSDASDVSDISSVFTQATDSTGLSQASLQSRDPLQMAAQTLAHYLYQDSVIHDSYSDAVQEFGSIRFSANHDRLLKIFWKDIARVTTQPKLEMLVRVLAKRRSRNLVTAYILRLFQTELDSSREDGASMQRVLDKQEDRNYSLNHFLQSQNPANTVADTDGLEDSDNDEETDDEGEMQDSEPGTFTEVEKVLDHITAGAPYQTFKSNLACLAHPPTNLAEALNTRNLRALRRLFRKQFNFIAQDEYAWLQDLEDLGHTRDEIAEILLEEASDAPWIYFTPPPEPVPMSSTQVDFHMAGCVHRLTWDSLNEAKDVYTSTFVSCSRESTSLLDIQRLCGLAGITPSSRDIEEWNGSVTFEEDNSAAWITFGHSDIWKVINRLEVTLEQFCTAIKYCQSQQLCCDSFTIIRLPPTLSVGVVHNRPSVEVHRIDFRDAFQLLSEVRALIAAQDITSHKLPTATRLLEDIFQRRPLAGLLAEANLPAAVQECSLSIQMMCLGFLSYLQAHVGPIHPVFLDTPIKKAKLFGCHIIDKEHSFTGIEMGLVNLTCIGEMLQGSVLVFKLAVATLPTRPMDYASSFKFDLSTSAEDLVDTWGPAQFILQSATSSLPSAIKIGGGVISSSNATCTEFHWSRDGPSTHLCEGTLDPTRQIRIGSPVSVNNDCVLDEKLCRTRSEDCGLLRYLGTFTPGWKLTEMQVGSQAGQYVMVQANAAYHQYPGRTLKQYRLEQGDQELLSFLEDCWAVQVSLCTNVARRVPLRKMVADLFPVFANTMTCSDDCSNWDSLRADYAIFAAFYGTELRQWLRNLPASHHNLVLRIIRRILNVLGESGLDRKGNTLLISWPYGSDVYQCLEINLGQQESSWARILADSQDCATFAYASPHCLETEEYRCRGAESCFWRNTVLLLETAVTVCESQERTAPPPVISKLVHQGTYFFKTFGTVHVVKAEQPDPTAVAKLVRKQSHIADKIMHRVYARTQLTKRIRERGRMEEVGGNVAWLTSSAYARTHK